jgi:hypothetical protein
MGNPSKKKYSGQTLLYSFHIDNGSSFQPVAG